MLFTLFFVVCRFQKKKKKTPLHIFPSLNCSLVSASLKTAFDLYNSRNHSRLLLYFLEIPTLDILFLGEQRWVLLAI